MTKIARAAKPKKPSLELTYDRLLGIFRHVMLKNAAKLTKGSYNPQDPTAFERIEAYVFFENFAPTSGEQDARAYHIKWNDVTWGIQIKVRDVTTSGAEVDLFDTYFDHDSGEFRNPPSIQIIEAFILGCLEDGDFRKSRPDVEAELDALSIDDGIYGEA